jgi:quercetin dioxygenase-like cupin family protein
MVRLARRVSGAASVWRSVATVLVRTYEDGVEDPRYSRDVRGYVVGPQEGVGGYDVDVKASAESTGGAITVMVGPPTTGGAPRHVHHREDECFYVLDGTISVEIGDERSEAGRGSFVFLPRDVPHAWDVESATATVMIITVPGGFEDFMREWEQTEGEARREVPSRYGIELLGP